MEEHRRTWFDERGINDGRRSLPLRSGSLHYWRVDPTSWSDALAAMVDAGFNAVTTYIPWAVHEVAEGRFDFSGERDVAGFLERAADAGLVAIVRPGPHINAELTRFGIPERVLARPECQARTASGTPAHLPAPPRMFPIPSYASPELIDETRAWIAEVGRAIGHLQAPDGPIVALQLDNEMAMFFRTGAFDLDYHPAALAWWREEAGDSAHDDDAPISWDAGDPDTCARWVAFKETYAARSMAWLAAAVDDAGLGGLARFHNGPPIAPVGLAPVAAGAASGSMPAWDCYQTLRSARRVREIGLYLAGSATLPMVAELGVGGPYYVPPPEPAAQASAAIALFGCGVRAFNFYMAVDRDRWVDAVLDDRGRDRTGWVAPFLAALERAGDVRPRPLVGLIESRADHRYAIASSVLDPAPPILGELVDLGPGGQAELGLDAEAREHGRWRRAVADALEDLEIPWVLVDQDVGVEVLSDFRLLVCPTVRRIDATLWASLRAAAAAGARVVLGPGEPSVDGFGRPLDDPGLVANMGLLRSETLGDLEALGGDLAGAAAPLDDRWIAPEDPGVVCSPLFREGTDELGALVVTNTTDRAIRARVVTTEGARFVDPINGERAGARGEVLGVDLGPRSARLFLPDA